jgi:hypothetical protein
MHILSTSLSGWGKMGPYEHCAQVFSQQLQLLSGSVHQLPHKRIRKFLKWQALSDSKCLRPLAIVILLSPVNPSNCQKWSWHDCYCLKLWSFGDIPYLSIDNWSMLSLVSPSRQWIRNGYVIQCWPVRHEVKSAGQCLGKFLGKPWREMVLPFLLMLLRLWYNSWNCCCHLAINLWLKPIPEAQEWQEFGSQRHHWVIEFTGPWVHAYSWLFCREENTFID